MTLGSSAAPLSRLASLRTSGLLVRTRNKGAIRIQVGQDAQATHVFQAAVLGGTRDSGQAHQSGLAALALNASGSLVATASETGTATWCAGAGGAVGLR